MNFEIVKKVAAKYAACTSGEIQNLVCSDRETTGAAVAVHEAI
jgi:hypothetical protein